MRFVLVEYLPEAGHLMASDLDATAYATLIHFERGEIQGNLLTMYDDRGKRIGAISASVFLIDPNPEARRRLKVHDPSRSVICRPDEVPEDIDSLAERLKGCLGEPIGSLSPGELGD